MISLKAIQSSFTPNHGLFHDREFFNKRKLMLSFCKSNNNSDNNTEQDSTLPEGDKSKQELLDRIAMLQAQKVRLTDYLDERSSYLTQFAEEANAEIDQIGENALRELDEAGAWIMGNTESRKQAFEESMELNRIDIDECEKKVTDFEGKIEEDRNEGMFFKSFRGKTQVDKAKAKEEAEKIREVTKKDAGSVIRRNIYLTLIALAVMGIAEASISSTSDWRKVTVLAVILVGLLSQLVNLKQAAWFSAVPWGTMAISGYIAGTASDYLIQFGYSTTTTRKIMQSIGFIGPVTALLCLNFAKSPSVASVFLTVALSLSSFSQAGFLLNMEVSFFTSDNQK